MTVGFLDAALVVALIAALGFASFAAEDTDWETDLVVVIFAVTATGFEVEALEPKNCLGSVSLYG